MALNNTYTTKGEYTVIPAADLASATSAANTRSDARKGSDGIGKRAGMVVLRDNGDGTYDLMIAQGPAPTDKWDLCDLGTPVTPS